MVNFEDNNVQKNGRFSSIPVKSLSDDLPKRNPAVCFDVSDGDDDSNDTDNSLSMNFLKLPPRTKKMKRKIKRKDTKERVRTNSKRASAKTIDSIPASIPEENSEDVMSSDPDIDNVEYVKTAATDETNQHTVHSVHQIFSELDELVRQQGEDVWEEKARWIKFEQDVNLGADKWSKPHVATLKLQSIIALRQCISQGIVLLGMNAFDLESVIEMTLDRLVSRAIITSEVAGQLRGLLLKRHIHTGEHSHDTPLKLRYKRNKIKNGVDVGKIRHEGMTPEISPSPSREHSRTNSEQELMKQHFLRRLPPDTEASNVMIGRVEYLDTPICVTIRLTHSILLGDITEVPIPTRFIFLFLCPLASRIEHVEVGRAASALFADEMFYKAAYSATGRAHLIQGIDRFLEKAIVIPPGEWDPRMKIAAPETIVAPFSDMEEEGNILQRDHSHKKPLEGIQCDLKGFRARWLKDWSRGCHWKALLAPLRLGPTALCYILLLHLISPVQALDRCLLAAGSLTILLSLLSSQPLLLSAPSLTTILWERELSRAMEHVDVPFDKVRMISGIAGGVFILLSSLSSPISITTYLTSFVYEIFLTSLPLSLVLVAALYLPHHLPALFLLLIALVFLVLWRSVTNSTAFTKKVRGTLRIFNVVFLIGLVVLTLYFVPSLRPTVSTPPAKDMVSTFPSRLTPVFIGIATGLALSVLLVLQFGLVFNWLIQPTHKIRRPNGRYLDPILIGLALIVSGVFNLPFMGPDPILTPALVSFLSVPSNGSTVHVRDQRLTQLITGVMLCLSALIPDLQLITFLPLSVCVAVVLFHCAVTFTTVQLAERCQLLFKSEKYHPERGYIENTPQSIINSYTILQLVLSVIVVGVTCAPYASLALPLLLVAIVLLREHLMPMVVFENLIQILEDTSSPMPLPCASPSPSLGPEAKEFSEEMSKLSQRYEPLLAQPESEPGGPEVPGLPFPQIIFDNLTDDDGQTFMCDDGGPATNAQEAEGQRKEEDHMIPALSPPLPPGPVEHWSRRESFERPLPFDTEEEEPMRSLDTFYREPEDGRLSKDGSYPFISFGLSG